jgi:hypothetical protein
MTKIAGIPEQLRASSTLLAVSAPELALAAEAFASAPLPKMPPGLVSVVEDALQRAATVLRGAAARADTEGKDLKRRGLWPEVAGTAFAAWELVEDAVSTATSTVRLYAVRRTSPSRVDELETSLVVTEQDVWLIAGEVDVRTGEGKLIGRRLNRPGLVEVLRAFVC